MAPLDWLLDLDRRWQGTSRLRDPKTGQPVDTPSGLSVTPVALHRFVRLER